MTSCMTFTTPAAGLDANNYTVTMLCRFALSVSECVDQSRFNVKSIAQTRFHAVTNSSHYSVYVVTY